MTESIKKEKKNEYVYDSRYQQIAVEIAERIASGVYDIGEKINARSTLASNFNVSPETARKAVNILVDLGIMSIKQGSGTYVLSKEKAQLFVERYRNVFSVQQLRQEIEESVNSQQKELAKFSKLLNTLVSQTKMNHAPEPFVPYELKITPKCVCIGATIGELNIWQQTGATIVAIKRGARHIVSPGPYEQIAKGDVIYFVGNDLSEQRMENILFEEKNRNK